jgi:hypothetical protein
VAAECSGEREKSEERDKREEEESSRRFKLFTRHVNWTGTTSGHIV